MRSLRCVLVGLVVLCGLVGCATVQEERIKKLEARLSAIEKQLVAQPVSPSKPSQPRKSVNPKLQAHLDVIQELHYAADVAATYAPHPSKKHLQAIRRLHEVKHQANERHQHPPRHYH